MKYYFWLAKTVNIFLANTCKHKSYLCFQSKKEVEVRMHIIP